MARVLIQATTGAATADFTVRSQELAHGPRSIKAFAMAAGDTIDLQMKSEAGTYEDVYEGGAQVQFAFQSTNIFPVTSPGVYRINKGVTTGAVQVEMSTYDEV